MNHFALFVQLEAKPGKEAEVEAFLKQGAALVREEPKTVAWFALRMAPNLFGIFDTFADESGRQAHLAGRVAAALNAKGAGSAREGAGNQEDRRSGGKAADLTIGGPLDRSVAALKRAAHPVPPRWTSKAVGSFF